MPGRVLCDIDGFNEPHLLWLLMRQAPILTIAHRLDTIRDVDTILIMDKGKVVKVGIGTPDELLAKMARKKNAGGGEEAEEEEGSEQE